MMAPTMTPPRRACLAFVPGLILLGVAACSSGDGGSVFDLPTAAPLGGPVLTSPRVQPIYLPGFPYATQMDAFLTKLAASSYWPTVSAEYGVGPLAVLPGYVSAVQVPSPIAHTQLPDVLTQVMAEGSAALGPARGDTIYALFLDPATMLSEDGMVFCGNGAPSAYHDEWTIGGVHVPAIVIPTCTRYPGDRLGMITGIDVLTPAVSHELVEASTDPFVRFDPAYAGIDPDHLLWAVVMNGAEVADLCENEQPELVFPDDIGRPVQRIWSNAAARAGTGPCVPVPPGEVYFNAVASLGSRAEYTASTDAVYTVPVMNRKIGEAATVEVSFRGPAAAPTNVAAIAYELDDANSLGVENPRPMSGLRGHSLSIPITTSLSTASGVVPLLIGAMDADRTVMHFWVGGVNRN